MEKTNVIKLKYLRAGQPSGREYTFYTPAPVEVGDIVDIAVVSPDNTRKTWKRAKLAVLESIMRRFGMEVNTTVGPLKLEMQSRAEFWRKQYEQLKKECGADTVPTAGKASPESGTDGGHYFYGGMHDNAYAKTGGGERDLLFKTR